MHMRYVDCTCSMQIFVHAPISYCTAYDLYLHVHVQKPLSISHTTTFLSVLSLMVSIMNPIYYNVN